MSFENAVSKLRLPIRELVLSASGNGGNFLGNDDNEKKEIIGWIDKLSEKNFVAESNLKILDSLLVPRTYIATNYLTAADVALYGLLHPIITKLKSTEYYGIPAVTRYFDHVQSAPAIRSSAVSFGDSYTIISFDLQDAPKLERNPDAGKKKAKSVKSMSTQPAETVAGTPIGSSADKQPQKEKGKKKEKGDAATSSNAIATKKQATAAAGDDSEPVPSMIDLRVGHIVDIMKHPDADSLYVEQIDLGEETGPRTVVSGLVNHIPIEQMRDKYLVAVCNLKPASMRGVKSFAMVLCATSKEGKHSAIELIQPPPGSQPGDRVYFEGQEFETSTPLSQLNPKKKIFETIQPGFTTLDTREAAWVDPVTKKVHKIRTTKGVCVAPSLVGATLS